MKLLLLRALLFAMASGCMAESLRVVTEDLPPYQIAENQKLIGGSNYELVVKLLAKSQINAKYEVLPWARAYAIAIAEPNVLIFSIARTAEREAHFHWIWQLDRMHYHFYSALSRPELQQIQSLPEVLSHTVATVRHSVEADLLKKMGFEQGKNLILTVTYKEAWQMVALNRADFTYANILLEDPDSATTTGATPLFVKGYTPGQSLDLYLAVSKNTDAQLLQKLQAGVAALQQP